MKKLLLSLLLVSTSFILLAQHSPMGMRYQAVVRDADGAIISNEGITARIELLTMEGNPQVYYEEIHEIHSNEFGILNLTIGEGRPLSGDFSDIPWSDQNIWVRTSIKRHGNNDYNIVTTNKLYSVPYAQYAKTAGSLVQKEYQALTTPLFGWPKVGFNWSLYGNALATKFRDPPLLGTTDETPVVFITNNTERMRITGQGTIEILTNLDLAANMAIAEDLKVNGTGMIADSFTVNGPVNFTDNLMVSGKATFVDSFSVNGPFNLAGDLKVDGKAMIADSFIVIGPTVFDINVDGLQTEKPSYPVLIKGSKQGLAIDLTPATDDCLVTHRGNNYISFWRDGVQKGRIEGMGRVDVDPYGLLTLLVKVITDPGNGLATVFGTNLTDPLENFASELAAGIHLDPGALPSLTGGEAPSLSGGSLPDVSFTPPDFDAGSFPTLDAGSFPTLTGGQLPTISFSDPMLSNPFEESVLESTFHGLLDNFNPENNSAGCYINEVSPAGNTWVLFKAALLDAGLYPIQPNNQVNYESQIFSTYTLNILQAGINTLASGVKFYASTLSILDPEDIFSTGLDFMVNILNLIIFGSYADIGLGVAYESGAGDYAEWLRRANPDELIHPGDVVGVIGGRVSKKFVNADRFMVVSTSPLLLGNMPETPEQERLSEKIAFIGQVPVKIMGDVNIGDYVLPSGLGDGTAIAVAPGEMLARDYQRIIGISWEENHDNSYIHLVNTAVGINHNDMAKVIEQMQFTLNHIQAQLKKMDPDYVSHDYEVTIDTFGGASLDYSVAKSHPAKVATYFKDKTYKSKAELLADVRDRLVNYAGIDLSIAPVIDYALSHPERAGQLASGYQYILNDLIKVKAELFEKITKE